jgi:DNA-binding MarR family transcriptional regulator
MEARTVTGEIHLRDTPALDVLNRRGAELGHIDPDSLLAAQDVLRVAKRLLGSFAQAFDAHGLSPGRYAALMALDVQRPSMAPSQIADRLGVTRATVTGLIDGLLRDGLVSYAPEGTDRRRKAIALTRKGEALIEVVVPDIFERMAAMMSPLSADERRVAVNLLGKVEAGLVTPGVVARKEALS